MGNGLGRPVGPAIRRRETSVNDTSADRSKQFLADLGKAMHSTAEAARLAATDECRSNAQAYTEYLRANSEGASLHKAAAADITSHPRPLEGRDGENSPGDRTADLAAQ